jgi:hypothetical protein
MTFMRALVVFISCLFSFLCGSGQSRICLEQYTYSGGGQRALFSPVLHVQTPNRWYAEARFNYEEINTFSLYAGHNFSAGNGLAWSFTPMAGWITGRMKGGSIGLNSDLSWNKFSFSSQTQYSISASTFYDNFFYNWSELYYSPSDWFYMGIAVEHTRLYASSAIVDPGLLAGLSFRGWSIPFYVFKPFHAKQFFVVGLSWEWRHAGADKRKVTLPAVL